MKRNISITVLLMLAISSTAISQQRSLQIGGRLMTELTLFDGIAPGFGGQVVYRMGKHGGIESGLYYQSRRLGYFIEVNTGGAIAQYYTSIAERRLHLPLLYRFDSKVINFVVGPAIDYFIGWKDRSDNPEFKITDYERSAVDFIFSLGVSKSIYLSPSIILEPEAKFNFITTSDDGGLGLNIGVRKIIF